MARSDPLIGSEEFPGEPLPAPASAEGNPPDPAEGNWFRVRKVPRPMVWAYGAGLLVAADVTGWLPESPATGISLAVGLTLALAKEVVRRD